MKKNIEVQLKTVFLFFSFNFCDYQKLLDLLQAFVNSFKSQLT